MTRHLRSFRVVAVLGVIMLAAAMGAPAAGASGAASASGSAAAYRVGPITDISACGRQNAEVEQAVDAKLGYVYEEWMGCTGIGFARSTDGGRTWDAPVNLPGTGSDKNAWDPAVTVAPDGTVYASYGSSAVWPGDTTGLSVLSPADVVASWGSDYTDMSGNQDEIYAANIAATLP